MSVQLPFSFASFFILFFYFTYQPQFPLSPFSCAPPPPSHPHPLFRGGKASLRESTKPGIHTKLRQDHHFPLYQPRIPAHRNGAVHSPDGSFYLIWKFIPSCLGTCLPGHSRPCQADNQYQYEPSQLLSYA